jgi:hypothetical protein
VLSLRSPISARGIAHERAGGEPDRRKGEGRPAYGGPPVGRPCKWGSTPNTITPITHVAAIFQKDVSFDHYFGTHPSAKNPFGKPLSGPDRGLARLPGLPESEGPAVFQLARRVGQHGVPGRIAHGSSRALGEDQHGHEGSPSREGEEGTGEDLHPVPEDRPEGVPEELPQSRHHRHDCTARPRRPKKAR